jgi:hypothetical protein
MSKKIIIVEVDDEQVMKSAEVDSVNEAILIESGWMEASGITAIDVQDFDNSI